jgi:plastocyanin
LFARRKSLLALIVVPVIMLFSVVAVGVANASRSGTTAPQHPAATPTITISMFAFSTPSSVPRKARIRVVNKDAVAHTVTSLVAGKFNVRIPPKSTRFFNAPAVAGNYKFHCTIHLTMTGVLHVVA